jgi:hypothetical protein
MLWPDGEQNKVPKSKALVKVLIQSSTRGGFYAALDEWVSSSDEATDFVTVSTALNFCLEHRIEDYTIHLGFGGGPEYNRILRS